MNANPVAYEDERMKILRMVEEGKLNASEGISLLNALGQERRVPAAAEPAAVIPPFQPGVKAEPAPAAAEAQPAAIRPSSNGGPRWFKVRVTNLETGRNKASITLPIGLVDWGLRIGARYAPEADIDMQEVGQMLRMGVEGKLIDVVDEEDGEHVEIFVE